MIGFEPTTFTLAKGKPLSQTTETTRTYESADSAPSDTPGDSTAKPTQDPRLALLIESWADLPEAIRAGIAAMVGASGPEGGQDAS